MQNIDISLEGKNRARLAMRTYAKAYTNVPNSALPASLFASLNTVYGFLTNGEALPQEDYTFVVRAKDGEFKRIYSPAVFSNPDATGLLICWGEVKIPLVIKEGKLQLTTPTGKTKYSFKVKTTKVNGYDSVVLLMSYVDPEKEVWNMPFPVRPANFEAGVDESELEFAIENEQLTELLAMIAEPPSPSDGNREEYSGSGDKLEGPVIKMSELDLGQFQITAFRRYKNNYGLQHLLQSYAEGDQVFSANVSEKVGDEWKSEIKEIVGPFILKANNAINKKLLADPVINIENPATLTILERAEFNGKPYVKANLEVTAYTKDEELFEMSF